MVLNDNEDVIFDKAHLDAFTGVDIELQRQVLRLFVDNAPAYLTALKRLGNENWCADAHKLKGAARSIGAWRLAHAAEKAEKMGEGAGNDPRSKMCAVMEERLSETIDIIKRIYFPDQISE